jgi:mycoredoxin
MTDKIILYGHMFCPSLGPVRGVLAQAKVDYTYINIHKDPDAAATVRSINNGYESVPTLVFPDGSTLTEPSIGQLKSKLESVGYRVGPLAWLVGYFWVVLFVGLMVLAVLRSMGVF